MKFFTDYNERELLKVAKETGVAQVRKDVSFARFLNHHDPDKLVCLRNEVCFILCSRHKDYLKIIGMAVIPIAQGKGYGRKLLSFAYQYAKGGGMQYLRTRTKSGAEYYAKHGFDVVGKKGDDFLMEYKL